MSGLIDRLQLRPQERRIIVAGAVVLFLLLNLWFVWPHFGSYARFHVQRLENDTKLSTYLLEIGRTNDYFARLGSLEKEGSGIVTDNNDLAVQNTLTAVARANGLNIPFNRVPQTGHGRTNEYFDQITFAAPIPPTAPDSLVNLLVSVASNQVVMRIKELDLRPSDVSRYRLAGNLKVVASFQKKSLTGAEPAKTAKPSKPAQPTR